MMITVGEVVSTDWLHGFQSDFLSEWSVGVVHWSRVFASSCD